MTVITEILALIAFVVMCYNMWYSYTQLHLVQDLFWDYEHDRYPILAKHNLIDIHYRLIHNIFPNWFIAIKEIGEGICTLKYLMIVSIGLFTIIFLGFPNIIVNTCYMLLIGCCVVVINTIKITISNIHVGFKGIYDITTGLECQDTLNEQQLNSLLLLVEEVRNDDFWERLKCDGTLTYTV